MSTNPNTIRPSFPAGPAHPGPSAEPSALRSVIRALGMQPHVEGGYFAETDRDRALVPSPFPPESSASAELLPQRPGFVPGFRNASTTIFYLLTPASPRGNFHRNRARTVHTLHRGRGRYVVIHTDEADGEEAAAGPRIETFVVGQDVEKGERLQWIVEGGKFKASFLLRPWSPGSSSATTTSSRSRV